MEEVMPVKAWGRGKATNFSGVGKKATQRRGNQEEKKNNVPNWGGVKKEK